MPSPTRIPQPLRGVVPPLATPLNSRDELDVAGLERLIEHVLAAEVNGLFILGTTGEGPALSYRLRAEVIQRTCEQVSGRVPVLVGITDTSLVEALHLSEIAAQSEADAVVMAPPYYLPLSQPQLIDYTHHLLHDLPLPLYLYNMPGLTKVWFELKTVAALLPHPRILGLKDSSGDLTYLRKAVEIARSRPDFSVLIGPERMLAEALTFGVHGGVCGGGNAFPHLFVELCRAYDRSDRAAFDEWQRRIVRLQDLFAISPDPSCVIQGVKGALSVLGICSPCLAEPVSELAGKELQQVQVIVEELMALAPVEPWAVT